MEQLAEAKAPTVRPAPKRRKLPETRKAVTHKFEIIGQTGTFEGYITVGLFDDGTPGEVFITIAKEGSTISGLADAFAKGVSQGLQYGVPIAEVVRMHKDARFEPWGNTKNSEIPVAKSFADYFARWLELKFVKAPLDAA